MHPKEDIIMVITPILWMEELRLRGSKTSRISWPGKWRSWDWVHDIWTALFFTCHGLAPWPSSKSRYFTSLPGDGSQKAAEGYAQLGCPKGDWLTRPLQQPAVLTTELQSKPEPQALWKRSSFNHQRKRNQSLSLAPKLEVKEKFSSHR